jgi:receptor protein-tyrosine kinase
MKYGTPESRQELSPPEQGEEASRPHRESVVEAALRKVDPRRQLVLRRGEEVAPGAELTALLNPGLPRVEEIGALRTTLMMLADAGSTLSLAVVSPCRGEGRTQLAAELAMSFAQAGKSTLLVDADMRRPKLHTLFNCEPDRGLAEGLIHRAAPYAHPVKGPANMEFVAAGNTAQSSPLELLSDSRLTGLMREWRKRYAFVILDTPPIMDFADGLAVATAAGSVLMVCQSKKTPYQQMKETMRRLSITQSRVLGAAMNTF